VPTKNGVASVLATQGARRRRYCLSASSVLGCTGTWRDLANLVRRTVSIENGTLLRIACPQGVWVKRPDGWRRMDIPVHELAGGAQTSCISCRSVTSSAGMIHPGRIARTAVATCAIHSYWFVRSGSDALRAAFRIHERAGRQAEALAQLRLLLGQTKKDTANYPVQAEIARFLEERMHRTADALTAWREAHRMEPGNPTPRAEIRRILLANGDHRAVAEELAALGGATSTPADRGELLLEAAEIYDDRLGDTERAIHRYLLDKSTIQGILHYPVVL